MKTFLLLLALAVVQARAFRYFGREESTANAAVDDRRLVEDGVVSLTVLDGDRGPWTLDDKWDFLELVDGVTIDLDQLGSLTEEDARGIDWGSARINVRANTVGDVGSVVFDYDDGAYTSTVETTDNPYETLMWNRDFAFRNGYHTLVVTGWSGNNGDGMELGHVQVGFTIVSATAEGAQNVPEFTSNNWSRLDGEDYPIDVTEAPSALLDGHLVLFSGYTGLWSAIPDVFAKDLGTPGSPWRRMPDYPLALGATHIPIALNGPKAYLVGGYLGRVEHPPPHMVNVFEFDLYGDDGNGSWRELPSLPAGRGGGAAFYLEGRHTLMYTLGATHARGEGTEDHLTTWWLDLNDEAAGWIQKGDGPYLGNHVKETVATDCDGNVHYFVYGGQLKELQRDNNLDEVWEYFPDTDHWEQRASLIQGRGHLASSPYSCGFFVVAGAINFYADQGLRTPDMSYYDIPTDTWTRVGDAPQARDNYACDIYQDVFYCTGGGTVQLRMRPLAVPSAAPTPVDEQPSAVPVEVPTPVDEPSAVPTPVDEPTVVPTSTPSLGPTGAPVGGPIAALYKLNCGGPARDDWESDEPYVVTGRSVDRTNFLSDRFDPDGPDFLYLTERHDTAANIVYDFPSVPDGSYSIQFMFAEVQGPIKSGDRVFSFYAEGLPIPEITDMDIYDQVGFAVPLIVTVEVTVSDGNGLQIESSAAADDAKVQGMIITPLAGGGPGTTTSVPSVAPTTLAPSLGPPTTLAPTISNSSPPVAPQVVYKINCGGPYDPAFPDWEVDDAYTSDGRSYTRSRFGVSRPTYSELFMYNTERHDTGTNPIEYDFPVENGSYDIDIYLMEAQVDGVGLRTMDVLVEGSLVLDEFDIYDYAAGVLGDGEGAKNTPFIYTIPSVAVSDGSLSLSFAPVLDDAKVNALVITKR